MSFGELTTFGDDAGGEADAGGGENQDAQPDRQEGQQARTEAQPREERQHHAGRQERDESGRFAGGVRPEESPTERKLPPEPEVKKPAVPERLRLRVPKEDGAGEDELEMTPEEASQRLAEARALAKAREQERARAEKAEREMKAFRSLQEGLKRGEGRGGLLRAFIRESGLSSEDAEEALAEALHGELQEQRLTPEQRRLRELEEREAAREREAKEAAAEAEHKRFTESARAKAAEYEKTWLAALEKTGLPASPQLLADIATHHLAAKKRGLTLTADELAQHASAEFDKGLGARLKDFTPEALEKRFPDMVKAWDARLEAMEPEVFVQKHPELARKMLRHFRSVAQAKRQPAVGAARPLAKAPPRAPEQDEGPIFYSQWGLSSEEGPKRPR